MEQERNINVPFAPLLLRYCFVQSVTVLLYRSVTTPLLPVTAPLLLRFCSVATPLLLRYCSLLLVTASLLAPLLLRYCNGAATEQQRSSNGEATEQ